jgi:hypothetical protein
LIVAISALEIGSNAHEIIDLIPAMYSDGINVSEEASLHDLLVASFTGVWCLVLCIVGLLLFVWLAFATEPIKVISPIGTGHFGPCYVWSFIISMFLVVLLLAWTDKNWPFWLWLPFAPILLVIYFFFWPFYAGTMILIASTEYVFKVYLTRSRSPSQSCFFMPCAPQSITETDQAFALLAGIFSIVVPEFGIPLFQRLLAEHRARILFQKDVERRIEMARITRMAVNQDNGAEAPEESNAADASGRGIRGLSRVNSGIVTEEGRAGAGWRVASNRT